MFTIKANFTKVKEYKENHLMQLSYDMVCLDLGATPRIKTFHTFVQTNVHFFLHLHTTKRKFEGNIFKKLQKIFTCYP